MLPRYSQMNSKLLAYRIKLFVYLNFEYCFSGSASSICVKVSVFAESSIFYVNLIVFILANSTAKKICALFCSHHMTGLVPAVARVNHSLNSNSNCLLFVANEHLPLLMKEGRFP